MARKQPNDNLTGTLEQWEEAVFQNACLFTVVTFPGQIRTEHKSFPEAVALAKRYERSLVYAITPEERFFCVPRVQWDHYLKVWNEKRPG